MIHLIPDPLELVCVSRTKVDREHLKCLQTKYGDMKHSLDVDEERWNNGADVSQRHNEIILVVRCPDSTAQLL